MKEGVYLGGHVCNTPGFSTWRESVTTTLFTKNQNIKTYDPTNNDEAVFSDSILGCVIGSKNEKASFHRCIKQMKQCSIFLFNFTLSNDISVGSIWEMGWAYANNGYIISVLSDVQYKKAHPFIGFSSVVFNNIDNAIEHIIDITK